MIKVMKPLRPNCSRRIKKRICAILAESLSNPERRKKIRAYLEKLYEKYNIVHKIVRFGNNMIIIDCGQFRHVQRPVAWQGSKLKFWGF